MNKQIILTCGRKDTSGFYDGEGWGMGINGDFNGFGWGKADGSGHIFSGGLGCGCASGWGNGYGSGRAPENQIDNE